MLESVRRVPGGCEVGMSAAVAPDLLGFHCGPMFAAGLPIRREAEVAPNFSR
jgi:hypothetical protein